MADNFHYAFGQISGLRFDQSSCIALRWEADEPFGLETGESHVYEKVGKGAHTELPTPGRFAGIWRGASGEVHVAQEGGVLYSRMSPDAPWSRQVVGGALAGVWGLDGSGLVYAWGFAPGGKDAQVFLRDASGRWSPIAIPDEIILEMHGVRPELIVAVGLRGSIFFLENRRWRRVASPVSAALASVFVVSDDEMYACGSDSRYLLEGSIYRWTRRGPFDERLYRVAKHRDTLWVGCGVSGLHRLAPGEVELERLRLSISVSHMDAREDLLVSGRDGFAGTSNGNQFQVQSLDSYERLSGIHPPSWVP